LVSSRYSRSQFRSAPERDRFAAHCEAGAADESTPCSSTCSGAARCQDGNSIGATVRRSATTIA
jgi:hypothetical protein